MQHSYEALDRPGGVGGAGLLSPLRHRDFRVLWAGMAVSLLGDGIFLIAVAWEAYSLWNAPAALALVGIGMTVPTILFLVPGGVVSDRLDRRAVMFTADAVRATAVAVLALLALTGSLRFWELVAVVAVYGAASAFFMPAFDAVVPDLLPSADLAAANSLDQFVRPIALRLAGPALGGVLVSVGTGVAFAVDAASFAVSGAAVLMMSPPPAPWRETAEPAFTAVRSGLRFVRGRVWLWGTLLSAAFAYLVFLGPAEVLLPYVVKNDLHASAGALGLVFAAGGLGAVGGAIVMAQRREPRRNITFMYATWTLATLAVAGYGLGDFRLAVDDRLSGLQCTRDGGHDRVGDPEATPRARVDARQGLESRLDDLDRLVATLVRPDGASCVRVRCSGDPRRVGPARRCDHAWSSLPPRHARPRASARRPENPPPRRRTIPGSRLTVRRSS